MMISRTKRIRSGGLWGAAGMENELCFFDHEDKGGGVVDCGVAKENGGVAWRDCLPREKRSCR